MKTLVKMQFDPEIAKKIGVEEAIMYSNIEYWCEKNKANNKGFYDGYYWTYNSKRAFTELFPFWTEDQISRILKNLEKKKYIKTGNYNKHKYDRTKWYATTYQNPKCIMANAIMEEGKQPNGNRQTPEPIPYNKPYNKTNNNILQTASADNENKNLDSNIPEKKQLSIQNNKQVAEIIDIFRKTNKALGFQNRTERKAISELIIEYSFEKIKDWAEFAVSAQKDKYAPMITTPFILQKKLVNLQSYKKRINNSNKLTNIHYAKDKNKYAGIGQTISSQ